MSIGIGIVGVGARTAVGRSLAASAAAVRARISRIGGHPFVFDARNRPLPTARAEWLRRDESGAQRFVMLAKNAAKEALASLGRRETPSVRVFVGLPEARPGLPGDLAAALVGALGPGTGWRAGIEGVTTMVGGHAAALVAIEAAARAIGSEETDLCLAGGVESYLPPETLVWLEDGGQIQKPRRPWGFVPGEAAGFCLLASPRWLEKTGRRAPLTLVGIGSARERNTILKRRVATGAGLGRAFDKALATTPDRSIARMIGDLNGEPYRVDEIGFAIARISNLLIRPGEVLSPARYRGDVGAASGALFAGLAFEAALRHRGVEETTLIWTSSERGRRSAAVLRSNPDFNQEQS